MKNIHWKHAFALLIMMILGFNIWAKTEMKELKTVDKVDLNRYMGTWYEICRYPQIFEKNLVGVTATYSLMPNGKVRVINAGYKNTLDGKRVQAKGKAKVADKVTNAKLKVTFFWPFYGDYWIIELGENYEYAVVGNPKRTGLWLLSRTPQMDDKLYNSLLQKIEGHGYDLSKIEKPVQISLKE
jgi:apolipoprotein D and lipocalin family protein